MAAKNKSMPRLGRGLSSLISNSLQQAQTDTQYQPQIAAATDASKSIIRTDKQPLTNMQIPIDNISSNPFQPRRKFDQADLAELAESIKQQGIIQPIVVTKSQDADAEKPYVLIAGERRLRAGRMAGLETVPCVIRQVSRQQMMEWALIENIQRSDLNPVERAQAYREYMDRFSLTHNEAAERLGQPRATVSNYLRILDLHQDVQQLLLDNRLSFGHAKVLAGLTGQDERQLALAKKTATKQLSVRQLEGLIAAESKDHSDTRRPHSKTKLPHIRDMEEQLTQAIGTRVSIHAGRAKHSGKIVIEYYSLDDFDRIGSLLGLKSES